MPANSNKQKYSHVAVTRCGDDLTQSVRETLEHIGGIAKFVKPGDNVFIKPNLTAGMPASSGGTTDVLFAEAVVRLVKEAAPSRVTVGECSGNESRSIESLTNLGYADMCARQGVEMADLDKAEFADYPLPGAYHRETVRLPRCVVESDVFISLPALKTHISVGITVTIKNSFGLLTDTGKTAAHRDSAVEEAIADIARVRAPDLTVVDGRIGAEGVAGGVDFEHPIKAGIVIASADPVAVDAVAARVMGQNPRVRHIRLAAEAGVGNDNMDYIILHGLTIEEAYTRFMTPGEQIMADSGGKVRPFDLSACSKCRATGEGGLWRYSLNPNSLLRPIDVVMGPGEWDAPADPAGCTVLAGDCIREEYRDKGTWISGCPASPSAYNAAVAAEGVTCSKCAVAVKELLDKYGPDTLSAIRVVASGREVFRGSNNSAGLEDYVLGVGRCQDFYCYNHGRRIHKYHDDAAQNYLTQVKGCPPDPVEVKSALDAMVERAKK